MGNEAYMKKFAKVDNNFNANRFKLRKFGLFTLVVIVLLLVIGVSYAIWTYNFIGSENTVSTSFISLEFLESGTEVISVDNVLPMKDSLGMVQSEAFNFAVITKTEGVRNVNYTIKLEKLNVDSGYTSFGDNQVKIYLTDYNNNVIFGPKLISDLSDYKLYSKTNSHSLGNVEMRDKYILRAWIDNNVDASSWTQNSKFQYKFKLAVEGNDDSSFNAVYSFSQSSVSRGMSLDLLNDYTRDYKTLNKSFFLKHNIGNNNEIEIQEVCYLLDNMQYCLKDCSVYNSDQDVCVERNFEANRAILFSSFGEENCTIDSDYVHCSSDGIKAHSFSDGYVSVADSVWLCDIYGYGVAKCSSGGAAPPD